MLEPFFMTAKSEQQHSHADPATHEPNDAGTSIHEIIIITIATAGILGNVLTLVAVAKRRSLKTASSVLMTNLTVADGMLGIMACLLFLIIIKHGYV